MDLRESSRYGTEGNSIFRSGASMRRLFELITLIGLGMTVLAGSAAGDAPPLETWQVIEGKTGRPVPFDDWITELSADDVIYLGEEHHNRWHVEAALRVLHALLARDRHPVLALEMFGWDGQHGLDHYLSDPNTSRESFLQESRWEQNWGGAYDDYEPLINFARDRHVSVVALNPPRPLVRQVALKGWSQAMADPDMARWGMQDQIGLDDLAYREIIFEQLRSCHEGLSEASYERMYEASVFRDEGMAKTLSDYLRTSRGGAGPVVSYTGGGHIQYRLPVPNRVLRRQNGQVKQVTIYLTSLDSTRADEIQHHVRESIADYLWLTPPSAHGFAKRCR